MSDAYAEYVEGYPDAPSTEVKPGTPDKRTTIRTPTDKSQFWVVTVYFEDGSMHVERRTELYSLKLPDLFRKDVAVKHIEIS